MADFRTYCNQNPYADDCLGMTNADWAALGYPVHNTTGGYNPSITILPGGVQSSTSNLDKYLATLLSGIALFQHAPYVPTNIQPQQQPIIYQQPINPNTGTYSGGSGGTALGKVELWLKNNTGVALMGAAAVALFLINPKRK